MKTQEEFYYFTEQLLAYAVQAFHSTKQYELLQEKLEQMDDDCECMFTENEREFAQECFALLQDVNEQQEQFIYRQGLQDCVTILKGLGVLA